MRARAWLWAALALLAPGCGPGSAGPPDAAPDAALDAARPDATIIDAAPDAPPADAAPDAAILDRPIQDLQDVTRVTHVAAGSLIRLDNVVVTARDPDSNLFVVQEPTGSSSYAGIVVIGDPLPVGGILPAVGDLVDLAGTVRETSRSGYAGSRTDIEALTFLAPRGVAPLPAPAAVTPAEIALSGLRAEEYEGVLVKTTAVTVGLTEPGFGIFTVTSGLIVGNRLFSATAPLSFPFQRDSYASVAGILDHDFGAPRLLPRDAGDLLGYIAAAPCLQALLPASSNVGEGQTVNLSAELDRPAPAGGSALSIDTSDGATAAPTSTTVTVTAGQTATAVPVSGVLASATAVTIGAGITGCGMVSGARKTALVTVLAGPNPHLSQLGPANLYVMAGGGAGSEGVLTLRLDRPAPPTPATVVTLASPDVRLAVPANLTVPPGATTAAFKVRGAGSASATPVVVTATLGADSRTAMVTLVTLASLPAAEQLQINELLAAPSAMLPDGDANCDGVANTGDDEFVELVNVATQPLDLANVQLNDAAATPNGHRFPAGYILGPGEVVVIFGGGAVAPMPALHPWCAGSFAGARIERANLRGSLGLNNTGDTLTVRAATGATLTQISYGAVAAGPSTTRDPDLTGALVVHTSAVGRAQDRPYSPGTRLTGTPFWLAIP